MHINGKRFVSAFQREIMSKLNDMQGSEYSIVDVDELLMFKSLLTLDDSNNV